MKQTIISALALSLGAVATVSAGEKEIKITSKYLNFPISHKVDRTRMELLAPGEEPMPFDVRISEEEPDYWTFKDVSRYRGKKLKLRYPDGAKGIDRIYQADTIHGESQIYREANRPAYHFTTRRGWINDPNGLVYLDGEYHLFYQHNPFERDWGNMTWGHAVSPDLMHWTELPTAIHPDPAGTIFSGSAVIDYDNDSGFGSKKKPAMVVAYTLDTPDREMQCIAYSLDNGRTFTKYAGNPVIDSKEKWNSRDTRDPKLMRYGDHWVMVLNERDGHSIYTSNNLRDWTFSSHVTGFWECPELFELAVDGDDSRKLWVMYGASGTYMLGNFDGYKFTPVSGKHRYVTGTCYAAQTYSNIPASDGRRIQIGWARQGHPGMPFNGMMQLPVELQLRTTKDGPRLTSRPVREAEALCHKAGSWTNLTQEQAEEVLKPFADAQTLRLRATLELSHATDASISLAGQRFVDYDMNGNTLNGTFYSPQDPTSMELTVDVWIDRTSVEVFVDGGLLNYAMGRHLPDGPREGFRVRGNRLKVKNLEVWNVDSVWPAATNEIFD